jgi:hypothetical protein
MAMAGHARVAMAVRAVLSLGVRPWLIVAPLVVFDRNGLAAMGKDEDLRSDPGLELRAATL